MQEPVCIKLYNPITYNYQVLSTTPHEVWVDDTQKKYEFAIKPTSYLYITLRFLTVVLEQINLKRLTVKIDFEVDKEIHKHVFKI